jgi:hypothetical protein
MAALAVLALSLLAQSGDFLPACPSAGHPCACMQHADQVQNEFMRSCMARQQDTNDLRDKKKKLKMSEMTANCFMTMQTHCDIAEHYGNWHKDENGEHDSPMPMQCARACTRSHCKCDADGSLCHFGHDPKEDKVVRR